MQIKFKKLTAEAVAPKQGTPGSAGFDLTATSMTFDTQYSVVVYGTGISVEIPKGYVGLVFPRSSIYKTGLVLSNAVGVIDSDYRGEIMAKFHLQIPGGVPYQIGDRIAQLVIVPIPDVDYIDSPDLSETERGTAGYGSTGK